MRLLRNQIPSLRLVSFAGLLCFAVPAGAQEAHISRIIVHVLDEAAAPLPGVQVRLRGAGVSAITNAQGIVELRSPLTGPDTLELLSLGQPGESVPVDLNRDEAVTVRITMSGTTPIQLERILVRAGPAPPGSFAGFWDRRARAQGYFVTREEIEALRPVHSADILRGIPGLRLIAARNGTFDVRLARPRHTSRDPGYRVRALHGNPGTPANDCPTQLFVDGHAYHNDTMSFDEAFRPNEIEAIEVYNSPGQTPAQFGGTRAQCGVIVIWLRRGL
jgi:hypothetical protein